MKSIALLLCLGAARAADLDGDGVTDAAAANTCCALSYGNLLSNCGGATDLAGTAGCCPSSGWLHRLSLQATGEDATKYDCVSFISQTDCAALSPWNGMVAQWIDGSV